MNITLYLNTTGEASVIELFAEGDKIASEVWRSERRLGDDLLPRVMELLGSKNLNLANLNQILVCPGPGSFTGTRIGVATANSLAWSLDIPVKSFDGPGKISDTDKGRHFSKPVQPVYASEPHVTMKKSFSQ